jgi:hypothetical protein
MATPRASPKPRASHGMMSDRMSMGSLSVFVHHPEREGEFGAAGW